MVRVRYRPEIFSCEVAISTTARAIICISTLDNLVASYGLSRIIMVLQICENGPTIRSMCSLNLKKHYKQNMHLKV